MTLMLLHPFAHVSRKIKEAKVQPIASVLRTPILLEVKSFIDLDDYSILLGCRFSVCSWTAAVQKGRLGFPSSGVFFWFDVQPQVRIILF